MNHLKKLVLATSLLMGILALSNSASADDGDRCWVDAFDRTQIRNLGSWPGSTESECHDAAWVAGDAYCNELRSGKPGPNPITLKYYRSNPNGGYTFYGYWVFGCEGVP
jgi:hypothetical protein